MLKTPVSILQEHTVAKKIAAPDYAVHGTGQPHCMTFTCNVKVNNQTAIGFGATKKDAKQDAAKNMLKMLGISTDNQSQMPNICLLPKKASKPEGPGINYIGKLNEYCSGHRQPQPTYTESSTLYNLQFSIICYLNNYKTEGFGLNKKDAKQDAAKKMLELIRENNDFGSDFVPIENPERKLEIDQVVADQVMKKYSELMHNLSLDDNGENNNSAVTINNEEINITTWEELINFLDKIGCRYEVSKFQKHPLILCLRINQHTLMQTGKTEEEIHKKLVINAVDLIKNGVDFSKPLVDL